MCGKSGSRGRNGGFCRAEATGRARKSETAVEATRANGGTGGMCRTGLVIYVKANWFFFFSFLFFLYLII